MGLLHVSAKQLPREEFQVLWSLTSELSNLVIGAISAPAFLFYLPSIHPVQGLSIQARLAPIDFVGLLTLHLLQAIRKLVSLA